MCRRNADAPGAHYTHRPNPGGGEWCTFEILIAEHHLDDDPALTRLAKIVHAADLNTNPLGPGLLTIGLGVRDVGLGEAFLDPAQQSADDPAVLPAALDDATPERPEIVTGQHQ